MERKLYKGGMEGGMWWNGRWNVVEWKVEYGTDLDPNGELEWIFGTERWNSGPEDGIVEGGT